MGGPGGEREKLARDTKKQNSHFYIWCQVFYWQQPISLQKITLTYSEETSHVQISTHRSLSHPLYRSIPIVNIKCQPIIFLIHESCGMISFPKVAHRLQKTEDGKHIRIKKKSVSGNWWKKAIIKNKYIQPRLCVHICKWQVSSIFFFYLFFRFLRWFITCFFFFFEWIPFIRWKMMN